MEALQALGEAVSLSPENDLYLFEYAGLLAKIPTRHKEAERHYLKSIELNPGRVENYIHLGRLYNQMQLPHRAKAQFRKALDIDPVNAPARKELDAVAAPQPTTADSGGLKSWISKLRKET